MVRRLALTFVACCIPATIAAHAMTTTYVLPVPFWMYLYGCAATLVVSFALVGYFWSSPGLATHPAAERVLTPNRFVGALGRWTLTLLRTGAIASLALTIAAGLMGTSNPQGNIGVALFWIVFLLGFTYATLLVGDLYSLISPWRVIVELVHSRGLDLTKPRVQYPAGAVYWPAFASYVALIWLELFVAPDPFGLSIILVVYSAVTFVGVYLFSQDTWFQRCDVFSVFFRLVSMLAPIKYVPSRSGESWQLRLRWPLVGALAAPAEVSASLILFVLFMLSSTTYDALHQTTIWAGWFWRPMLGFSQPLWGDDLGLAQQLLENWFLVYQRLGLLISPLAYFGLFILCLVLVRRIAAIRVPLRVLARDFAYTLLPIAVVYNMTHYAPVFLAEIRGMPLHLTDPLDRGWNVLGLADVTAVPSELPMAIVWHIQVALIVAGHVASVYLAHVVASRIGPTRRQVLISQLPLLLLMVALTAAGLWVLALPLAT